MLGVVGVFLIKTYGNGILESGQATVLILSNVYGTLLLVSLLAHGLIKMPIFFWKYTDNTYNLINSLQRADRVRKAYRTALIEYHE